MLAPCDATQSLVKLADVLQGTHATQRLSGGLCCHCHVLHVHKVCACLGPLVELGLHGCQLVLVLVLLNSQLQFLPCHVQVSC